MPERAKEGRRPRSLWSGTIAFGLVSLPVAMFVANRGRPVSLRLLDQDGTPLTRQYFCPEEGKMLSRDEIVRGYEVEDGEFVVVSDDELAALAPEKSQEIDLRRFVDLEEIDPVYFERAYFLLPNQGASKAYRLLARAMESEGKAGIATFVMRDKEYLVAIIAQNGILRAETLRFGDELRSPDDIGLPELKDAKGELVQQMVAQMKELNRDELDETELVDRQSRRLLALAQEKIDRGEDVVEVSEEVEEEFDGGQVVDLMRLLKESLREVEPGEAAQTGAGGTGGGGTGALREKSKAELYEQAKEMDIPGRSGMTKEELIRAIRRPR